MQQLNFNLVPSSIEGASNINRILNNQKFRQVYLEGTDASLQRSLPNLQQRNFLFDYNYALSHNFSRSLRFNFNAATSSIIRQNADINSGDIQKTNNNQHILWQNILNTGNQIHIFSLWHLIINFPFNTSPF